MRHSIIGFLDLKNEILEDVEEDDEKDDDGYIKWVLDSGSSLHFLANNTLKR